MSGNNPTGREISLAAWVPPLVKRWGYPKGEENGFLLSLTQVPSEAMVAGGFATHLFTHLRKRGEDVGAALNDLGFRRTPNKFGMMPLNHYLLTLAYVARRMGRGAHMRDDLALVKEVVIRSMGAALIRSTLPGFVGADRVDEVLRLVSKAFTGIFFSHTKVDVKKIPGGWRVQHRQEFNFLAHHFYADGYRSLLGSKSQVDAISFHWTGPNEAELIILERAPI